MSNLKNLINSYFKSENLELINEITNNNIWKPNNNMVFEYKKYLNKLAELNRLKYSLEYSIIPQSKKLIKELRQKTISNNPDDKKQISNIRKEMCNTELKMSMMQNMINELLNSDNLITEKWDKYIESANNFLKINKINDKITLIHILSNECLYKFCESIKEDYFNNQSLDLKVITDLINFFDFEYENKTNTEKLIKFDLLFDNKIYNLPKFIENNTENPIIYELNIENNIFEINDNSISFLYEEVELLL